MDTEILSDRLAATEAAVLQLDERVDAEEETGAEGTSEAILEARLATLEGMITQCLTQLQSMQQNQEMASSEVEIAKIEAEAEVEVAKVEAEAAIAMVEAASEPEEPEVMVEEIAPEPASEGVGQESSRPKSSWIENLLVLR